MKEITMQKFHDILYKFFSVICCGGLFFLSMDLLLLSSRHSLYFVQIPMQGWYNVIPLSLDGLMITLGYLLARHHKKHSVEAKWR